MHLVAGQPFGRYVVEAWIGHGGQAEVYRATQQGTGRSVALKMFTRINDPAGRRRFMQEARAAARVEHPNIVPVYEAGEEQGIPFIAMRLVPGPALSEVLARHGALPVHRALGILDDVAHAVDAVHAAHMVHRDVKPANVLLDGLDTAFLSDFGVARIGDVPGLTKAGDLLGTVEYMSPEELRGEPAAEASDIYAFGVLAFEVLTGRRPFASRVWQEVVSAHLGSEPPSVRTLVPGMPAAVDEALAPALGKDPGGRPDTATKVADALRRAFAGWTPPAAPAGWAPDEMTRVHHGISQETSVGTRAASAPTVVDQAREASPAAPSPRRARSLVPLVVLGLLLAGGGGAYAGWSREHGRVARLQTEKRAEFTRGRTTGLAAGRAAGHKAGLAEGLAAGTKQGMAKGLAQGRTQGKAEGVRQGRTVPNATPGQFRVVRADPQGLSEYLGNPMSTDGGCFVVRPGGDVTVLEMVGGFFVCPVVAGSGQG